MLNKLFLSSKNEQNRHFGPAKCPVFIKLPWMGKVFNDIERKTKNNMDNLFFAINVIFIFSKRTILPPTPKKSLPTQLLGNEIYEYKCECDARYIGRASQRLGDRIKQHVPTSIRNGTVPSRQQTERVCKKSNLSSCDSAIGKHHLNNSHCGDSYSEDNFKISKKCR